MGFSVSVAATPEEHQRFDPSASRFVGLSPPSEAGDDAFVVVSTQGAGDRAALKSAAAMNARYRAFVGSRRKAETLRSDLVKEGVSEAVLAAIKAPAGLDISAISADEIALSILAEMVAMRRRPERPPVEDAIDWREVIG
jgi:xanthine dehydrogenase accessory factor